MTSAVSPRDLAALAFADLDTIDRRCLSNFDRRKDDPAGKERALRRLAAAMDAEFGPLPEPPPAYLRAGRAGEGEQ